MNRANIRENEGLPLHMKIAQGRMVRERGCYMTESAKEFIVSKKRDYAAAQTQTNRVNRWNAEVDIVNLHTTLFITGEITDGNFMTLQDIKNYFLQLKDNPFDMAPGEANAKICADMHKLCRGGLRVKDVTHRLVAKSLGVNRVAYFNVQLARSLIHAERDKKKQAAMNVRLDKILAYEDREGYQPL